MIESLPVTVSPARARDARASAPCDNCGCEDGVVIFYNRDYISDESFAILRCRQCQIARTDIAPDAELQLYYGPAYYGEKARRFHPGIEQAISRFRNQRADRVGRLRPTPGRILDIGCGRGLMLAELKRRGWESAGTERSAGLASMISQQTGLAIRAGDTLSACHFETAEFDVVTLWHVLEHLAEPIKTIQEIHRILKPDGWVVIEVPNLESWQARLGGGRWFHLDAPRHLYHFSAGQLTRVLDRLGFRTVRPGTFSLEYGPYGMCQTLLNRITQTPNVLYRMLKQAEIQSAHLSALRMSDIVITLACALPVGLLATGLEAASALFNRGGIARVVAQKI